jgi:enoyl-CoA hydratase/carnithine racemase
MSIDVHVDDGIAHIVLNAPDRLNATTLQDIVDFTAALTRFGVDQNIRGLVLRGEGKAFCAGADLDYLEDLRAMDGAERSDKLRHGFDLIRLLIRFPAPTTAVVDGACFGLGACYAMACDRIVVTPRAKFGFVFTGLGIPAGDLAAVWLLSRRVGTRPAWHILERASVVSGETALARGLADAIVDAPGEEIVNGLDWTDGTRAAVRTTKRQVLELEGAFGQLDAQMETQLAELTAAVGGADFAEGLRSIRERRPAIFQRPTS